MNTPQQSVMGMPESTGVPTGALHEEEAGWVAERQAVVPVLYATSTSVTLAGHVHSVEISAIGDIHLPR